VNKQQSAYRFSIPRPRLEFIDEAARFGVNVYPRGMLLPGIIFRQGKIIHFYDGQPIPLEIAANLT
jgi:hypothetical protein